MSDRAVTVGLDLPPEFVRAVAEEVAAILRDEAPTTADDGYLDVAGAAAFLACGTSRIYSLVSAGRIPVHRDGSRLLFDRGELRAYVAAGGARRP